MRLKASVIIPAYNAERNLYRCLNSLEHQSFKRGEYEIIVVDDGSTDKTSDIVRKFNVHMISQKRSGPAAARNNAAKEASGDILLFIDSDCDADRDWVRSMVGSFASPEICGVQGVYKTNQKGLTPRFVQVEIEERYKLMKKKKYIDFIGTYAAGYRRNKFFEMDMFDISFPIASGEDADLSFRMADNGCKMILNTDAIAYHQHPDTIRAYLRQKFWRGYWRNLLYKKNVRKALRDSYTPQLLKLQILLIGYMFMSSFLIPFYGKISFFTLLFGLTTFLASTIPFIRFALSKDISVGVISPFYVFLRSTALFSGMLAGFFREIILSRLDYKNLKNRAFSKP